MTLGFDIFQFIFRIILAGFPPAITPDGIECVTTAFAAIIAPSPIFTPGNIIALSPIHTLLPILQALWNIFYVVWVLY